MGLLRNAGNRQNGRAFGASPWRDMPVREASGSGCTLAASSGRGAAHGRAAALGLCLSACLALSTAHAQHHLDAPRVRAIQFSPAATSAATERPDPPRLAASTSEAVSKVSCPQSAELDGASYCGYLPVALREGASSPTISIYFEVYAHNSKGPAVSAIFANGGGPGLTTTGSRDLILSLYGGVLDVHDLVLFDDRGRGGSSAINCPDLQHGSAPFDHAVAECAAQLGSGTSDYGTGSVADDAEALRVALGYETIDYIALSYGGEDATAYATRYGAHVRSLILDAPAGSPYLRAFAADQGSARSIPRVIALGCRRSPTCSVDHPDPEAELAALIQSLHSQPLSGFGNNAGGVPTAVTIDEGSLAAMLTAGTFPPVGAPGSGGFVDDNELLAAARAYMNGDATPLLRIGAEAIVPLSIDYGDPTFFSEGAFIATQCVDMQQPFAWADPVALRAEELNGVISALPEGYFAPFTGDVARFPIFAFEEQCVNWQRHATSDPVLPPRAVFPNVPVLVLHGDMDAVISDEEARGVASQFPQSTFVSVASSGHVTAAFGLCGTTISITFLETLQTGDTTCAQTSEIVWPAVGRFPLSVEDALPAEPDEGNRGTTRDLQIVSIAVATMKDALQRTTLGSASGACLRGGTFEDAIGSIFQLVTLSGCLFSQDVAISGTITYGTDTSVTATLAVAVAGGAPQTIDVTGAFLKPGPVGAFHVTGQFDHRHVAALVPES